MPQDHQNSSVVFRWSNASVLTLQRLQSDADIPISLGDSTRDLGKRNSTLLEILSRFL